MENHCVLPDSPIFGAGLLSRAFADLGLSSFLQACRWAHELPYGYNSDRDDPLILFTERKGTCTTKHAAIATLAQELALPVEKHLGIYAMTEAIVAGTDSILGSFGLPYLPMLHCFLVSGEHRVDLTEGNRNGKRCSIEEFLRSERVRPAITAREEYLLYRTVLIELIGSRDELRGIDLHTVLRAREEGLNLLKANLALVVPTACRVSQ
ncbi:MAG: hypothetical protein ACYC9Y_08925 [Candidatus Methylomirabilia bacterium]